MRLSLCQDVGAEGAQYGAWRVDVATEESGPVLLWAVYDSLYDSLKGSLLRPYVSGAIFQLSPIY